MRTPLTHARTPVSHRGECRDRPPGIVAPPGSPLLGLQVTTPLLQVMLHAAVANSNREMYDFLIQLGANDQVSAFGLSPLKLSVRLGKLKMFEHMYG